MNSTGVAAHPFKFCEEVSAVCPVRATTLGYRPNVGINVFFAIGFGAAAAALLAGLAVGGGGRGQQRTGAPTRTWAYSCFVAAGAVLELAGYACRVPLHANPWNKSAFEGQIVAIILAPTLVCVGIYLTLQHVCLALSPAHARVRPALYPWLFVPADVTCLLVQAIGGALAASAGYTNTALLRDGNRAIMAGIVLQVVVLAFFGLSALDYGLRVRRWIGAGGGVDPAVVALWHDGRFRRFCLAVAVAYACILVRCIYRTAEMAGGWGNRIMQDQPSFIVLEGFMILLAVCILAGFQPAFLFPQMAVTRKQRKALDEAADPPADHTDHTDHTDSGTPPVALAPLPASEKRAG